MSFLHAFGLAARVVAAVWLNIWIVFRYWEAFHPSPATCGLIGCSLNTATYYVLAALAISVVAAVIDLLLRKPTGIEDMFFSALHGLLIFVLAAGISFAVEKTPEIRAWLEPLVT